MAVTYDLKTERAPVTRKAPPVVYPTSDGEPMAETGKHVLLMIYCIAALRLFYENAQDTVYVAGNNFLFYEEGNPKARLSPDTYVVFGVPQWERDSYKMWEEKGRGPGVVFEFTSKKTKDEDLTGKFQLYEQVLKVPEYFLFDPTNDYIAERLRGFRLEDGRYVPIALADGRMHSEQMGLDLVVDGEFMRLFDPKTNRFLPTLTEAEAQRQAETLRAETEAARAETEAARAETEAARADAEAMRAAAAEDEVARLRAELAALRAG